MSATSADFNIVKLDTEQNELACYKKQVLFRLCDVRTCYFSGILNLNLINWISCSVGGLRRLT